ncbi:MAG: hypothetical protein HRU38_02085 [Saccharospirillaceae bacterium]|nr:hypothetical protein [Pseudomonadales bacterium]NRB77449.1 hypothetical protein [Saccharospirillaceae bacterium]
MQMQKRIFTYIRFKYAILLGILGCAPLYFGDLFGYCMFSGFIVGFIFSAYVDKLENKRAVILMGITMGVIAIWLSSLLQVLVEDLFLSQNIVLMDYLIEPIKTVFIFSILTLGFPLFVFTLVTFCAWYFTLNRHHPGLDSQLQIRDD